MPDHYITTEKCCSRVDLLTCNYTAASIISGKNSQGVNTERATNTKKRKKAEGKRAEKDTRQPQSLSDALQDYSTLMFLWVDYDAWNWNVGKIH